MATTWRPCAGWITVNDQERAELTAWSHDEPAVAARIEAAIRFRAEVLTAFDLSDWRN